MITQSILAIALMYGAYRLSKHFDNVSINKSKHILLMKRERMKQVSYFRERMRNEFGSKIDECMPSYEAMVSSSDELTAKNWIDSDRLSDKIDMEDMPGLYLPLTANLSYIHLN